MLPSTRSELWLSAARLGALGVVVAMTIYHAETRNSSWNESANVALSWVIWITLAFAMWAAAVRVWSIDLDRTWQAVVAGAELVAALVVARFTFNYAWPLLALLAPRAMVIGAQLGTRYLIGYLALALGGCLFVVPQALIGRADTWMVAVLVLVVTPLVGQLLMTLSRQDGPAQADTQNDIVGAISHELRSPLHVVNTAARLIDRSRMAKEDLPLLESISASTKTLMSLVEDLLDEAAIKAGSLELPKEPFSIASIEARLRDAIQTDADAKRINLSWAVDTTIPTLFGPRRHIQQVLVNLATNAVKYTPEEGRVHVAIHAEATNEPNHLVLLCSVSDTGIGIPESEKDRIFDRFHQVSKGATRTRSGVGLGLSLVKSYSDAMGGRIAHFPNKPRGTLFTWRVPLELAGEGSVVTEQDALSLLASHKARSRPLECLVVDDSANNRSLLIDLLKRGGHRATGREDGAVGLKAIRSQPFDLIFLDLHMPGMSGFEVIDALRTSPGLDRVPPILMLTAAADPNTARSAVERGARGCLSKPLAIEKLISAIEEIASGGDAPLEPRESHDAPDPAGRMSHLGLLREVSPAAAEQFLVATRDDMAEAHSAFTTATTQNDNAGAMQSVHRMKNNCLNAGLDDLAVECQRIYDAISQGAAASEFLDDAARLTAETLRAIDREPELRGRGAS